MARFKILRGSESSLPNIKSNGTIYICKDTHNIWVDIDDSRFKLSAEFAAKLKGSKVIIDPDELNTWMENTSTSLTTLTDALAQKSQVQIITWGADD